MDKKLRQQYNLPDFLTGKTPAEDHKLLMKRFKDRKDPVSQRTMQSITEKLAQVQEDVKAQQNQGMMQEQAPMPEQGMPQGQVPQEQMPQQGAPDMGQMFAHGGKMNKYAHGGLHTPVDPNTPGASVDTVRDFDKFKDLPLKEFHRNMPLTDASFTQQPSAREEFTARALERGDISFEDAKTKLFPNQMGHGGKVNKYMLGSLMPKMGMTGGPGVQAPKGSLPTGGGSAGGSGVKKLGQTVSAAPMKIANAFNNMNEQEMAMGTPTKFFKQNDNNSFAIGGMAQAADMAAGMAADKMNQQIGNASSILNTAGTWGEGQKVDTTGGMTYDIGDFKKQNNGMAVAGDIAGASMKMAKGDILGAGADAAKLASDHLFGGNKKTLEKMKEANFQHGQAQALNKTGISSFAYGGKVNKYEGGGIPPEEREGENGLKQIVTEINANRSTPKANYNAFPNFTNNFALSSGASTVGPKNQVDLGKLKMLAEQNKRSSTRTAPYASQGTTTGKPSPVMPGQYATDGPSIFDYDKPSSNNYADAFKKYMTPTERESLVKGAEGGGASLEGGNAASGEEDKTKAGKALQALGRFGKNNAADLLSLGAKTLPLLKKHDKPNTAGATRVQKEYTPQQFDEKRFINEQRASDNSKEQIRNLSGGDPAAARAMAMSANRNKLFATSKGMQAADDLNRSEKAKQFDSQSRNEQINARMTEIYKDRKAKDDAAYSKAEYDRKSQIGDNVSKFAKELSDKQTVVNMTGYRGNATYVTPEGNNVEVTIDDKGDVIDKKTGKKMENVDKNKLKASN